MRKLLTLTFIGVVALNASIENAPSCDKAEHDYQEQMTVLRKFDDITHWYMDKFSDENAFNAVDTDASITKNRDLVEQSLRGEINFKQLVEMFDYSVFKN